MWTHPRQPLSAYHRVVILFEVYEENLVSHRYIIQGKKESILIAFSNNWIFFFDTTSTSCIDHLENIGSLSYIYLPNVDTFNYTIQK